MHVVLRMLTIAIAAAHQVWSILEIYTYMDVATLCELNADSSLTAINTDRCANPAERLRDVSAREYIQLPVDPLYVPANSDITR